MQPALPPTIVLVRPKKLEWRARVLSRKDDKVGVVILSKKKTTAKVMEDQTRPFAVANILAKNLKLRRAYEEAQKLV